MMQSISALAAELHATRQDLEEARETIAGLSDCLERLRNMANGLGPDVGEAVSDEIAACEWVFDISRTPSGGGAT